MRKRMLILAGATVACAGLPASSAMAGPPDRASDPFVCPVLGISQQAADNSGRFAPLPSGGYTLAPGSAGSSDTFNGNVPNHATNGDGTGSPGGAHSSPGDTDYSAIWSGN